MPTAAIAIGANLPSQAGSPADTIHQAVEQLAGLGSLVSRSSLYQTSPVGFVAQPPFVNAAAILETRLAPEALLEALLDIERSFGRERSRGPAKGPRTLDLDLLLYGDRVLETPLLTVPHPALQDRRFVLAPLAEVAPAWRHPLLGRTMAELLAALPTGAESVLRIESSAPGRTQ